MIYICQKWCTDYDDLRFGADKTATMCISQKGPIHKVHCTLENVPIKQVEGMNISVQ